MSGPFGSQQWMYATGAAEGQSLRFNDDDTAYLSWTPASAGNRKTWTWSGWVKRGNLGSEQHIFSSGTTNPDPRGFLRFDATNDTLSFGYNNGTTWYIATTNAVFRDISSWYHIVIKFDLTQSTNTDRVKLYVNNISQSFSSYPTWDTADQVFNSTIPMLIGRQFTLSSNYFDGYLSEVNFIDGQALDPTSFGETNSKGLWVPKTFAGTYGTNGFYLPFTNDYTVEGFNTVTYRGNGGTQYIGGVGFEPDLVWIKSRDGTSSHRLQDTVRGAGKELYSNLTNAEATQSTSITAFNSDGFTLGSLAGVNYSGEGYVAWCWDAGTGSPVSNTDGSITSTVKANPDYGFSIVNYIGTGAAATIGHGLSSAPEMVIIKSRTGVTDWIVYTDLVDGSWDYLDLNTTDAKANTTVFSTDADTFDFSASSAAANASGGNYISYCFHSVAGYSDFGSYTGNGSSTGPTVTTGFKPAFVMIKRTDSAADWQLYDNVRDTTNPVTATVAANKTDAESTFASGYDIDFNSTGFQIATGPSIAINASGGTYIYMAFADKREAAFWLDQSGNNNDWTNNNMQESDISLDNPTNNFATLNPLSGDTTSFTLSEGNLESVTASSGYGKSASTIGMSSGKWYWEVLYVTDNSTDNCMVGIGTQSTLSASNHLGATTGGHGYYAYNGNHYDNGTSTAYGSVFGVGSIVGVALDVDSGTLTFYKDGVSQGVAEASLASGETWFAAISDANNSVSITTVSNFGQDSSFAGNKVAQGNTDANGRGDFYYEPPAGYLALCTANLPEPAILDGSEHFNTVLYTGNGSTQSITGVGFQPDLVWTKARSAAKWHYLSDVVRGTSSQLYTNATSAEGTYTNAITSFDADGFSLGVNTDINASSQTQVAWNWKADNTSGTTNTDGTITSTVSANPTAGFSIVSYTGTNSATETVGHGLSQAPDMVIVKSRDSAVNFWCVYHSGVDATSPENYLMRLNTTDARLAGSAYFNNTAPTSSVFTIGTSSAINNTDNFIAYCFHSVEGYSKFGSYTGNGSADGPFVYTGFRPAFVLLKCSSAVTSWWVYDTARGTYNEINVALVPNATNADTSGYPLDVLSNGFKWRTSNGDFNGSGRTYIYMAFAENPFKYSNAR